MSRNLLGNACIVQMGETAMTIVNAEHGKLLLTADLLQKTGKFWLSTRRIEDQTSGLMGLRFPPIEDVVTALDHIASREIAA